jgi:hypothetical protein
LVKGRGRVWVWVAVTVTVTVRVRVRVRVRDRVRVRVEFYRGGQACMLCTIIYVSKIVSPPTNDDTQVYLYTSVDLQAGKICTGKSQTLWLY